MSEQAPQDMFTGWSLSDIVKRMASLDSDIKALNENKTVLQKEYDTIRKYALPDAMDEAGMSNMKITGIGRISLRSDVYASIPPAHKAEAFDWLKGTAHGGVIKESVHAGTLKALMKELIREGKELPPEDLIRVQPYTMAVLTRSSGDS